MPIPSEYTLTIKNVIEQLNSKYGVIITERTLQRYAKKSLIPKPFKKGNGRGKGVLTLYRRDTPFKFYEAWLNKRGIVLI